jgi:glutathione S-transferase
VTPLLWHLPISHYSEKVRWALDWKRIPHRRRVMPPGFHPLGAFVLAGGYTMPVLVLEGRPIGDSTAIIAALEERYPDARPLYPSDPAERARALEIEDWFDENAGAYARRWAFNEMLSVPEGVREFAVKQLEWAAWMPAERVAPLTKLFVRVRYSAENEARVAESRSRLVAALDKIEDSLGGREFLAGNEFSVADLTAAALMYPLVAPPEAPWQPQTVTPAMAEFRDSVRERTAFQWLLETWRRWRRA